MHNEIPILKFSSYTPKYSGVGLYLDASRFHGGAETSAVWLHGILVIKSNEDEEDWLKSLNMSVISEANQLPQIASVITGRITVQEHVKDAVLDDDTTARVLPFSFNLRDVLGRGLYEDNFYIRVSARQYCSNPVRVVRAESTLPSYLEMIETDDSRFSEVNQLIKGYDAYSANRFSDAVEFFAKALKSKNIRGDIDRPNLYNAAYCAGQAALEAEPEGAEQLLDKTTQWMQEGLQLRNNLLIQIQKLLIAQNGNANKDRLEKRRSQLLYDLGVIEVSL